MQLLRSLIFFVWMYGLMAVMGIILSPLAAWSAAGATWAVKTYVRIILRAMPWFVGLRAEIRGQAPTGLAVVASKHQSFLDILMLVDALEKPRFVMKRSLRWTPVLGFYAMRMGCAPVNRGGGGEAVSAMVESAARIEAEDGQTIIYPQGTRVAPGVRRPYKGGVHALAQSQGAAVIPAATNAGLFWARIGVLRRPGTAVLEFLPALPPGLERKAMTNALAAVIEPASDRLDAEARAAYGTLNGAPPPAG